MNKEKVEAYIDYIEQLGADARFSFDMENNGALEMKLESIIYWCKKALKELKKEDK